jgi:hypothetical protein
MRWTIVVSRGLGRSTAGEGHVLVTTSARFVLDLGVKSGVRG